MPQVSFQSISDEKAIEYVKNLLGIILFRIDNDNKIILRNDTENMKTKKTKFFRIQQLARQVGCVLEKCPGGYSLTNNANGVTAEEKTLEEVLSTLADDSSFNFRAKLWPEK